MKIEEYNEDYAIREFTLHKGNHQVKLGWNYREGTHFLIFLYDRGYEFSLKKAKEILIEAGISDEQVVKNLPDNTPLYKGENGGLQIFCLKREEFLKAKKCHTLALASAKPCEISVFNCAYDKKEKSLAVYLPQAQENIQSIPIEVRYQLQYTKSIFGAKKKCILQIPALEGYQSGAIAYHVSGTVGDIPLSPKCLGKKLYITMPDRDAEITVRVQEKYRKYYRLT